MGISKSKIMKKIMRQYLKEWKLRNQEIKNLRKKSKKLITEQ